MKKNRTKSLMVFFVALVYIFGFKYTLDLVFQVLKLLNSVLLQFTNTSILTVMCKHYIVFSIVGIILCIIGTRVKEGHLMGKVLYFIVGYIIGFVLNLLAKIIF